MDAEINHGGPLVEDIIQQRYEKLIVESLITDTYWYIIKYDGDHLDKSGIEGFHVLHSMKGKTSQHKRENLNKSLI